MLNNLPLIYFVRHGQTDWNAAKRLQGETDIPINAKGRDQARRNGGVLAEVIGDSSEMDFVASPLLRTCQTMDIVRETMGLPASGYRTDDRLQEIRFGAWSGFTLDEIARADPENYARRQADAWNVAPPGGECYRELNDRLLDWLSGVTRPTIIVSHGGVSRCLRGYVLDLPPVEIVHLDVPQDKVFMVNGRNVSWL